MDRDADRVTSSELQVKHATIVEKDADIAGGDADRVTIPDKPFLIIGKDADIVDGGADRVTCPELQAKPAAFIERVLHEPLEAITAT